MVSRREEVLKQGTRQEQDGSRSQVGKDEHPGATQHFNKAGDRLLIVHTPPEIEALKRNAMVIASLTVAFTNNPDLDCVNFIGESQFRIWPPGRAHEVVRELLDEFCPKDQMEKKNSPSKQAGQDANARWQKPGENVLSDHRHSRQEIGNRWDTRRSRLKHCRETQ